VRSAYLFCVLAAVAACGDSFESGPGSASSSSAGGSGATGGGGGQGGDAGSGGSVGPKCGDHDFEPGELCFADPVSYPTTKQEAYDLALADCDIDGDLDVLAVHRAGTALVGLRNDGEGVLGELALTSNLAGHPVALALGELFGGAGLDVAVVYDDVQYTDIYSASGSCLFDFASAEYWNNMAAGWHDAAVGKFANTLGDDLVALGAQLGVRPYGQSSTVISAFTPGGTAIVAGDFDGDRIDDVAYTDTNADKILWKQGTGSGIAIATPTEVSLAATPVTIAIGDVDGDQDLDLVTANDDHTVSVVRNEGGVFMLLVPDVSVQGGSVNARDPRAIALGDMDGDGDLDVVTANSDDGPGESSISILVNDGSGKLALADGFPRRVTRKPYGVGAGDLNGDDALDIVTASAFVDGTTSSVDVILADP
jgi:VCBS repeat protein